MLLTSSVPWNKREWRRISHPQSLKGGDLDNRKFAGNWLTFNELGGGDHKDNIMKIPMGDGADLLANYFCVIRYLLIYLFLSFFIFPYLLVRVSY